MVLADSSTLIHLSAIGRLSLLKDLYGHLTVTGAVWREVVDQGKGRPGVAELETARQEGWVEVVAPSNQPLLQSLQQDLDEGEAEVIALAVEHPGSLVLLDEAEARRRIESARTDLNKLRTEAGFWIDEILYRKVIEAAGE